MIYRKLVPAIVAQALTHMKFALLEPDLNELDRILEFLASAGHICFGATNDTAFRRLLTEVSVDACLIDWVDPDSCRYETLSQMMQSGTAMAVVLCVAPGTPRDAIDSGLKQGASFSIDKPLRHIESLEPLSLWKMNGFPRSCACANRIM